MPDAPLDLDANERAFPRSENGTVFADGKIVALIAELRRTRAERDMLEKAHAANNRALDTALAERDESIRQHQQTLEHNRHLLDDGATVAAERDAAKEKYRAQMLAHSMIVTVAASANEKLDTALAALLAEPSTIEAAIFAFIKSANDRSATTAVNSYDMRAALTAVVKLLTEETP